MPEEANARNARNLFQGCNVAGYREAVEVLWVQWNNIYVCVAQQISSKSKTDDSTKGDTLAFPMLVLVDIFGMLHSAKWIHLHSQLLL
jgi:hypothetical protein